MPEEVKACPLCGGTASEPFDRREFRKTPVINRLCTSCGLVYQSPRMTEAELQSFYEAEYRRLYQGDEGPSAKDLAIQGRRAESLSEFVRKHDLHLSRHLDIGCSSGLLLKSFKEEFGSQPVGVEPGEAYRAYAREQAIPVYASLDEVRGSDEAAFDLVSLVHVLEHLPDPVGYLAEIRQRELAGSGWLLVEVPNLYAHDSFEVAHLVSFSPHSLAQVIEKAGYDLVALEPHGRPRSELIPLYLTLLARPGQDFQGEASFRAQAERGVKARRRLGMLQRRLVTRLFPRRAWLPI